VKRTLKVTLWILVMLHPTLAGAQLRRESIQLEKDVAMRTHDGVMLRADIYRPSLDGKFPVLLQRNPYNKDRWPSGSWPSHSPAWLASQGYVAIIQDTRGRYASEGEFYPFRDEIRDGYEAVEWAASLPYSNGRVCLYGSSYVGATQWLAALAHPAHLAALFPVMTSSDYYQGWIYRGGALELLFSGFWMNYLAIDTLSRRASQATSTLEWTEALPLADYPLMAMPDARAVAPYFRDWLDHESDGSYWSRWSIEKNYDTLKLPAYHVGGWYDIFLEGTLRNFTELRKRHPGLRHYLTVGPWTHDSPSDRKYGGLDFGPAAPLDTDKELLAYADLSLKGKKKRNPLAQRAAVKIFVMGENVWREESEWPLRRARSTHYYLHSGGGANSSSGDGVLSVQVPGKEPFDSFVYDPRNPVPTTGGPLCCSRELKSGPFDQGKVEARSDVLVYSAPFLKEPLEVTGPVKVVLYVSSDVPDTDFTAKLVDVYPDEKAYNLTEGILRMRRREGWDKLAPPLQKDQIYRIEVDLIGTSNLFQKGHRIRLEISSSNFPRFDRNLNTGESVLNGRNIRVARNQVFHRGSHPSALVLPVVPR